MLPRIAEAVRDLSLFAGLDEEQVQPPCRRLHPGDVRARSRSSSRPSIRAGRCTSSCGEKSRSSQSGVLGSPVGVVQAGECLGEISLLTGSRPLGDGHRPDGRRDGRPGPPGSRRANPAPARTSGFTSTGTWPPGLGEKLKRSGSTPTSRRESSAPDRA